VPCASRLWKHAIDQSIDFGDKMNNRIPSRRNPKPVPAERAGAAEELTSTPNIPYNDRRYVRRLRRRGAQQLKEILKHDNTIREEISTLIEQCKVKSFRLAGAPLESLRDQLRKAVLGPTPRIWPKARPEDRYENRASRWESAPDFIRRQYGAWLDGTFSRADLRHVDDSADKGLRNWESRNHRLELTELNLPTVSQRTTAQIEAGLHEDDQARAARNVANAAAGRRYREKKASPS
jgi:hypothetical protein